jgi:hydrogenase-4 component F
MEFLLLLASPLSGALMLAVMGARRFAPELNIAVSAVTFLAACGLTARSSSIPSMYSW